MTMHSVVLVVVVYLGLPASPGGVQYDGQVFQVYPDLQDVPNATTPLYFALMQSFSGGYVSAGGIPGLMVALDEINSNSAVLPGYSLHYTLSDNACVRFQSQRTLFSQLREDRTKIAAVGSGCSLATEPAAEISHFWNIPQISCQTSSPTLRNRERFQYYYQTIGSEENQGLADFGVIKYYGWKKVTIFQLDIDSFEIVTLVLRDRLRDLGVRVNVKTFEEDQGIVGLGEDPFDDGSRIYVWITYSNFGRQLLCKAYQRGLMYPRFTFLHPAWWVGDWWVGDNTTESFTCTVEDRERVVFRSIAVLLYEYIENYADVAQTGTNGHQYQAAFDKHFHSFTAAELGEPNPYGQACYDATWILALALNNTLTDLVQNSVLNARAAAEAKTDGEFGLEHFTYNNTSILEVLDGHLSNTDFLGITGRVHFDQDGIRGGRRLFIYQMRYNNAGSLTQHEIARVDENFTFTYSYNETDESVWPDGILYDGVPREELVTLNISVTVIIIFLAFCGVILTAACLIFNFVFRERRLIRLTSPKLNYIIGAGAVLLYVGISVFVIPSTDPDVEKVLCHITPWLTSIGFSLCFGTIMAKMARVFYIFHNPKLKRRRIMKDSHLVLFVCALVMIDVVILFVYTLVEELMGSQLPKRTVSAEKPSEILGIMEVEYQYFIYTCSSTARNITAGILYGYKAVLQVLTLVMALKTRKVNVQGMDDYREIAMATYLTSFVLVINLVVKYAVEDQINTFKAVTSLSFFTGTTAVVVLVFIPKMVSLYKDPAGKLVFSKTIRGDDHRPDVGQLRARVRHSEKQVVSTSDTDWKSTSDTNWKSTIDTDWKSTSDKGPSMKTNSF